MVKIESNVVTDLAVFADKIKYSAVCIVICYINISCDKNEMDH